LQNSAEIEKNREVNPWLRRNTIIIETGQKIKLSEFLRNVAELGYSKVWEATHRGELSQKGGVIHIFPINTNNVYAVEFEGNYIAEITAASSLKPGFERAKKPGFSPVAAVFHPGDYVVHIDHGIGIFREQTETDLAIEYAAPKNAPTKPDLLFVPKKQQSRLQPYLGLKKPEIHRLGTPIWSLTKKKAKEDIIEFAKGLLEVLAKRKLVIRQPYIAEPELEEKLIATFPHEYTTSQKKALSEIYSELSSSIPIDRILAGDVGFGKTEVALMAAFRVVLNNRQVAIIAPTTILADQHYETFRNRLKPFAVEVGRLTRLESPKDIMETLKKCESGKLDIIIGTHKLLGKKIKWKNLGLLIVDEEQKFGVAQKEQFKKTFPVLDVLTLSATPIPRTLNTALAGIKQLSILDIAPGGRKKIETYVLPKNQKTIKEAILFEITRGGQIYFLANRIHKIPFLIKELNQLNIYAKIGILHGRMSEKNIVSTMHNFRVKKLDILVSTTIIENGLDLSNVNTLIVEDATRLGLSQAHQLRGRIGRGETEAYAYFLYPTQHLKEKAAERLEALERYSWLGAGLEIAKRDLEIRGAGNILGKAQSGVAYKVGLNLYFQLLQEAMEEIRHGVAKPPS